MVNKATRDLPKLKLQMCACAAFLFLVQVSRLDSLLDMEYISPARCKLILNNPTGESQRL
jgi:hypothetical protein